MKKHFVKPQFYLYAKRKNRLQNDAALYMRIHYQHATIEKSLGIKIPFDKWNQQKNSIINSPYHQQQVEDIFTEYKEKIMGCFYQLSQNKIEFTLKEIVMMALGSKEQKRISVLCVFSDEILKMERLQTHPRQSANILKHHTCKRYLSQFIKSHLKVSDINFNRINRKFLDDFHDYLTSDCGNAHNSAMKLMQIFKKIYTIAINNRWTDSNAFVGKKLSYVDPDIESLNEEELDAIKNLNDVSPFLNRIKQLFLFCTYTGMAYIDLQNLQRKHLAYKPNTNLYFIRKKREKTGVEFLLPLFEPAQQILNNWWNNWEKLPADSFLAPRLSNQKFNAYLKDLASLAGIDKKLTTHIGRHTFATTIALENGVPLETVSKMVGHSKLSQTQKYAKVTTLKIERETKELYNKLK